MFAVGISQYLLLGLILNYGFTPDDWGLLLFYKTLGHNPLSQILYVWSVKGAYTTGPIYFIGILNDFFGLNYQAYQITNIVLKTLATLSLFPLILIIFKRRSLAFLTTILYGISYMGSRSLEYVVKGTDYLAIIPMNVFFIIYYYIVTEKSKGVWWFVLMSFFWFTSLMVSPIRIYPILVLIPLIEIYLWLQNRTIKNAVRSIKRLAVLYLPFLPVVLYSPNSILGFLQNPHAIFKAILDGNWHLFLTPFQGVGLSVFTTNYWGKVFGVANLESLSSFLYFLSGGPLFIFGLFTLLLSLVKFKQRLRGFVVILGTSFIFFVASFFIASNLYERTGGAFDPNKIYAVLIGGFVLAISFASFLEWKTSEKKDSLLLALWISPPIILLYTFLIWLLAPFGVGFEGQQGYYLVVPAIAASLFLAAILVIILDKAIRIKSNLKLIVVGGVIMSLFYSYSINRNDIYYFFSSAGINGRYASDQERMYDQLIGYLKGDFKKGESILFYFDAFEDGARGTFYTETLLLNLASRLHIERGGINGCIGVFYQDLSNLEKLVVVKNNVKGFTYKEQCGKEFFSINNFYAFKLKNEQLTDIKQEVLEKLGIK